MRKNIHCKRSIAAHQSLQCTSVRTKVSLHASQWAPGVFLPEAAKCAKQGTTRELLQGLIPALIGQSQGGFMWRCWARRGLHHLFVSLLLSGTDLICLSVPGLQGIGVLDTTKKVTEECWDRDYDLLIRSSLNPGLRMGVCGAHSGE